MLFIHIGMHKAGSTTIQHFLTENAARLARDGVAYPEVGRPQFAHHDLAAALAAGGPSPLWATIAGLAREGTAVVSSETFCSLSPQPLAEMLGGVETRILCWQRNAADGVVSRYAQNTKRANNLLPFAAWLAKNVDGERYLAAPTLAPWVEVFGASAVRVRSIEPEMLEGGDLILDLLSAIGAEDRADYARPGPQNISPGWRALETIRALNQDILAGADSEREQLFSRKILFKLMAEAEQREGLYERGAYLDPAQAQAIVGRYNADIDALADMGVDARLKRLAVDEVRTSDGPLEVVATDTARLLHRFVTLLAAEDFGKGEDKAERRQRKAAKAANRKETS